MVDIANIPDPLSPEERAKLKEERRLKIKEESEAATQKNINNVLGQINRPDKNR